MNGVRLAVRALRLSTASRPVSFSKRWAFAISSRTSSGFPVGFPPGVEATRYRMRGFDRFAPVLDLFREICRIDDGQLQRLDIPPSCSINSTTFRPAPSARLREVRALPLIRSQRPMKRRAVFAFPSRSRFGSRSLRDPGHGSLRLFQLSVDLRQVRTFRPFDRHVSGGFARARHVGKSVGSRGRPGRSLTSIVKRSGCKSFVCASSAPARPQTHGWASRDPCAELAEVA